MPAVGLYEDRLAPLEATARTWATLSARTVRRLCGLGMEPWSVAAALYRHGMLPQSRLAALCHTHKVGISRSVELLVRDKRWLMRLAPGPDARVRHLVLTEKGLAEVAVVAEALSGLRHLCLSGMETQDMAQMHALLRRMEDSMQRVDLADYLGRAEWPG